VICSPVSGTSPGYPVPPASGTGICSTAASRGQPRRQLDRRRYGFAGSVPPSMPAVSGSNPCQGVGDLRVWSAALTQTGRVAGRPTGSSAACRPRRVSVCSSTLTVRRFTSTPDPEQGLRRHRIGSGNRPAGNAEVVAFSSQVRRPRPAYTGQPFLRGQHTCRVDSRRSWLGDGGVRVGR
jgi:hypothetical protein